MTWIATLNGAGRGYARHRCADWYMAANWLRGMLDAAMPETDGKHPTLTYDAAVKALRAAEPGRAFHTVAGHFVAQIEPAS